MKANTLIQRRAGFTAVELSIYTLIAVILAGLTFSILLTSVSLTGKNSNLNRSHDDLRLAFDRLAHNLSFANNVPTLINTSGVADTTVTTAAVPAGLGAMTGNLTGTAPGVKFDRVISEPFVLEAPGTPNDPEAAGTVPATATSLTVLYAQNPLTHVNHITPTAAATTFNNEGLILLVPMASGTPLRLKIASTSARTTVGTKWFKVTLNFTGQIGQGFSWGVKQPQIVKVIRHEAFIVFREEVGTPRERCVLRYYKNFEPMPTLSDATKYSVLCGQIGIKPGEDKPFGILDYAGDKFVQSALRVRERGNFKGGTAQSVGAGDEAFYTYFQLHVNLPSRFRPRTTL